MKKVTLFNIGDRVNETFHKKYLENKKNIWLGVQPATNLLKSLLVSKFSYLLTPFFGRHYLSSLEFQGRFSRITKLRSIQSIEFLFYFFYIYRKKLNTINFYPNNLFNLYLYYYYLKVWGKEFQLRKQTNNYLIFLCQKNPFRTTNREL